MKNVFRREISAKPHGNSFYARDVLPFSVTNNSALKLSWGIGVTNLVKIGEKLRLPALTKDKNLVTAEVGRRAYSLTKSVLAVNGKINTSFIWEPMFQI